MGRPSNDAGLASELLSDALQARETIAQAQGVVMARRHVGPGEAAAMLDRAARAADLDVLTFATDIVRAIGTTLGPAISQARD